MPVLASELKMFRSLNVSNTPAANGGRRSAVEVVGGVNNNIFPDVSQAERTAGLISMRKVFYRNMNAASLPLLNSRLFMENYTQGNDAVYMHAGNNTNIETNLTGTEKLYGCGQLDTNVAAGATSMSVLLENSAYQFLASGDVVRISDKATITGAGNEEFVTISGTPSLAGSVVTFNFTPALQNPYLASSTRVANVLAAGDIKVSVTTPVASTVGNGDFTFSAGANLYGSNLGSVADDWTLTFTSATAFSCTGLYSGAIGTGNTLADYSPTNPLNSSPFFTLLSAGFTGVWAAGDTLTFSTVPADVAIWVKRVVPAGASAVAGNRFIIGIDGETA